MTVTLRFEIFPQNLDVIVDFYTRVLRFSVTKDQRGDQYAYVALRRGAVHIGAAQRPLPAAPAERRPPIGVELVLEVDDVAGESMSDLPARARTYWRHACPTPSHRR